LPAGTEDEREDVLLTSWRAASGNLVQRGGTRRHYRCRVKYNA